LKSFAEASTGEAAVRLALELNPDVVLLDIRMPEGDGLNALGASNSIGPICRS